MEREYKFKGRVSFHDLKAFALRFIKDDSALTRYADQSYNIDANINHLYFVDYYSPESSSVKKKRTRERYRSRLQYNLYKILGISTFAPHRIEEQEKELLNIQDHMIISKESRITIKPTEAIYYPNITRTQRSRIHITLQTPWGSLGNPDHTFLISLDHVEDKNDSWYEVEIELSRNISIELDKDCESSNKTIANRAQYFRTLLLVDFATLAERFQKEFPNTKLTTRPKFRY